MQNIWTPKHKNTKKHKNICVCKTPPMLFYGEKFIERIFNKRKNLYHQKE
jgi:hypothetical protein